MTDLPFRPFADDAAVRRIGEGLLARTLPKSDWTHEAHLAACLWLVIERSDMRPDFDLPAIISGYNAAVGGVNDDHNGYHHTITMTYLAAVREFAKTVVPGQGLCTSVNRLLAAPCGSRDWPLRRYSRARLFSVEARRGYLPPDLD